MYRSVSKTLVTCGLVILTGPLCFTTSAQSYVDVEAERAAAQAAGQSTGTRNTAPEDPYGAPPAQEYPATSYGVHNAPPAPSGADASTYDTPATMAAVPTSSSGSQAAGSDQGRLFLQIQQLQQEVMRLNGKLEEQAYELQTLKEQSMQRYMDLDKRLGGAGAPASTTGAVPQTARPAGAPGTGNTAAGVPAAGVPAAGVPAAGKPLAGPSDAIDASGPIVPPGGNRPASAKGEASAYGAAYALVQSRQFDQAIPAFQKFLQNYPDGVYAANAHYWLGELYLVKQPPDLEASRQSFALLLKEYPDNSKAPDALYKLGKVQFLKGNREKAREYLDLVIKQYEGTNNAVVKMAKDFIAQNY
jgi:tol-pal system protein YbgF